MEVSNGKIKYKSSSRRARFDVQEVTEPYRSPAMVFFFPFVIIKLSKISTNVVLYPTYSIPEFLGIVGIVGIMQ